MIHIDFQGGAHGNYLEFVCNKIAGIAVGTPFNAQGASHQKIYTGQKVFFADHYSYLPRVLQFDKIISIQITADDLLPLQQISLLRAGDYGYDSDQLEINTFNKFNNRHYAWVLKNIIDSFFQNQVQNSYLAVKDPSWPDVQSIKDFEKLPEWIKLECRQQHNLQLLELSAEHPDCPRSILREFFQIGFERPMVHGFIVQQQQVKYDQDKQVYWFPYSAFYHMKEFLQEIEKVAVWSDIVYNCPDEIEKLHNEFLQKQPYRNSKIRCDDIVEKINSNNMVTPPYANLIEQAYINAKLGWNYFV